MGGSVGETLQLVVDVGSAPEDARTLGRAGGHHQSCCESTRLIGEHACGVAWHLESHASHTGEVGHVDLQGTACETGIQHGHAVTSVRASSAVGSGFG
mgnify:CR=1 FL=1